MTTGAISPLQVEAYQETARAEWNDFVECQSVNAHFMHSRDYLDHHGDRFADHSLIFRRQDRIVAVLPAHRNGKVLASHRGLTFAGLLVDDAFGPDDCLEAFSALGEHARAIGLRTLDYRPVPVWYHRQVFEIDRSLPGRLTFLPAAVVPIDGEIRFNATRRNLLARGLRAGLKAESANVDLREAMDLVTRVLETRHGVTPVHSFEELEELKARFQNRIRCYGVRDTGGRALLGCAVVFVSQQAVKLQYVGYADGASESGAMEVLYAHLFGLAEFGGRNFDLGTTAGKNGIDESLLRYKESLGARLRVVPRYLVDTADLAPEALRTLNP